VQLHRPEAMSSGIFVFGESGVWGGPPVITRASVGRESDYGALYLGGGVQQEQVAAATRSGLSWLAGREVVVASHRGPVEYHVDDNGSLLAARGSGGVMCALTGLSSSVPFAWVSAAMTEGDRLAARATSRVEVPSSCIEARLVSVPESVYDAHYGFFSNRVLWFIQHGLGEEIRDRFDEAELSRGWATGYQVMNSAFAGAVARAARGPAPLFLLHDYQLYQLPRAVRQLARRGRILHFTHIPWPPPAAWEVLPLPILRQLVQGMLGADIVGFQDPGSARHFLATCAALLPMADVDYRASRVRHPMGETLARSYPISVDPDALREEMRGADTQRYRAALGAKCREVTIVRVDRVDPAKNIPLGFEAFGALLGRRPDLVGKARFLAFMVPSRASLPEYQTEYARVRAVADEVNARFGSDGYQPIELFYENNWQQALAGMSLADVVLVNSLADGMNLVAKEAAIVSNKDSALVLSTETGAWAELGGAALGVDPRSLEGTATALERAIDMPPRERAVRAAALRLRTESHDVWDWLNDQCEDLAALELTTAPFPLGETGDAPLARAG
jgi:trehalose 6-phosphate synthase